MKNSITFSSNPAPKKSISSLAAKGRSISLSNGPTLAALSGSMAVTSGEGIQVGPDLTKQQESMQLFERIPIVWTRRRGETGGVLIAPKATECRFVTPSEPRQEPYISNNKIHYRTVNLDLPNTVKAYYHLVVSEGKLGGIQVRDVFQGRCRVGQFSQSYSKRAGKWSPGNFLKDVYRNVIYFYSDVNSSNVDFILSENALIAKAVPAPVSCGTAGTYEGLTTFSFAVEYVNGSDPYDIELEDQGFWKRQIHLFIRNGAQTTRLLDNTYGSSDNLADLYLWLLTKNRRMAPQQIDYDSLRAAARFMDANGLLWNGVLSEPQSISDWINSIGRYFLVRETKIGGRYGLRPLLPVTASGAIDTGTLSPSWVFDSVAVENGSYSITYRDAENRRPFQAIMAWRQQGDDGLSGITRSSAAIYDDTPSWAPIEEHDLTRFATSEIHAVKAGIFDQAKRRYVTHTAKAKIRPGYYDSRLGEGDLIAIQLDRNDLDGINDPLVEWYWVTSMDAARDGALSLELEQCPVDAYGRSLVALDVAQATAPGDLFITGNMGPSCDADPSRATDQSVPAEDALSRTREEVYFYNKYGRFPDNNEYASGPIGPIASASGGAKAGYAGQPLAPPARPPSPPKRPDPKPPSPPEEPLGPEKWPDLPPGCSIVCSYDENGVKRVCRMECQPPGDPSGTPIPSPPVGKQDLPDTQTVWAALVTWVTPNGGGITIVTETITTLPPGGHCYIIGWANLAKRKVAIMVKAPGVPDVVYLTFDSTQYIGANLESVSLFSYPANDPTKTKTYSTFDGT